MVLSQRERYIAICATGVAVLLLSELFVIGPYFARRDAIAAESAAIERDINQREVLFHEQKKLQKIWIDMNANGLQHTQSEAESQLYNSLEQWSQDSGINVSILKYERSTPEGKFIQVSYRLDGTGPLSTIAKLLWRVETSPMPLRVNELEISPRKEGQDDLQLQMSVSTLCRLPELDKAVDRTHAAGATAYAVGGMP